MTAEQYGMTKGWKGRTGLGGMVATGGWEAGLRKSKYVVQICWKLFFFCHTTLLGDGVDPVELNGRQCFFFH